jgi:LmbE family N-acetylglucosaminyl deacetylase
MKRILVVAAHPDDEVLGCGATIAKHNGAGDEVHVVILAEGATSRDEKRDRAQRQSELTKLGISAKKANDIIGSFAMILHDFPDNRMDSIDLLDIVKVVEQHLERIKPEIVYTHHAGDLNIDHQLIHQAVVTACRPQPFQSVKTLLFFEIPSSTEWQPSGSSVPFLPNWFVDVSATLAVKLKALQEYESEIRVWPHSRSIESIEYLARWRGGCVGVEAAEAFVVGRNLVK